MGAANCHADNSMNLMILPSLGVATLIALSALLFSQEILDQMERWRAQARLQNQRPDRQRLGAWVGLARSRTALAFEAALPQDWKDRMEILARVAGQSEARPGEIALAALALAFLGVLVFYALGFEFLAVLGCFFGIWPFSRLSEQGRRRKEQLRCALPQALDLLATAVRAGQSFEQSLHRITPRLEVGPLRSQLEAALAAMRVGQSRAWALKEAADRADVDELSLAVESILMAERRGLALAPALKEQAVRQRALRLAAAQRQAARAPLKMLFPIMFCIMPAVFVVLFAPIWIRLAELGW